MTTRVVVVEDERIVALHLKQQLAKLGYDVVAVAASGDKALEAIAELRPHVVLLDIHIDGNIDGIDVASRIPSEFEIPVIYLTAYSEESTLARARETKPYGFLVKPFSERDLHANIQMALERNRADSALRHAERELGRLNDQLRLEIAERESYAHKLLEERDTAQTYLDVAGVMILVLDPTGLVKLINRHGARILGYSSPRGIIGKSWIDEFIPERMHDQVSSSYVRLTDGDGATAEFTTHPVRTKTGEERILSWHNAAVVDPKGQLVATVSSGDDITDRLRVEESLRSSEGRFRSIFSAVSDGIFIVDAETGKFTEVNEPGATIYGYTPEDMIGLDIESISANEPPYTQKDALVWIERAATSGQNQQFDWRGKRKDGRLIWVEVTIRFAHIGGRRVVLSIVRDVTDRRALEAQLRQALKLEALGTLAGGVAHELNNLLQPIIMMTELVVTELPKDSRHVPQLLRVVDAGGKAAEIVHRILAFGRMDEGSRELLDIAAVLRESISFIRTTLPATITLQIDIDESVGQVRGDKTQLTQVLLNLATNARDAIGTNIGTVWVSLSKVDFVKTPVDHALKPGSYAVVKVRDTGAGMDEATAQRIFEPFFTTKGVGKGTGLGLSVTHGIITGHGGAIEVDSTPGLGTTFSIYLPAGGRDVDLALTG